jgi:predicted nucleic acid-binding Zn ribbon protein
MGLRPVSTSRTPESVKALLSRSSQTALSNVAQHRQSQKDWHVWLGSKLPAALAARITGVVERDENLVIFGESAAWSARLRYAIAELDAEIRRAKPALRAVNVRVMPRA